MDKIDDKNPADNTGWTPLHLAAHYQLWHVVKFMVNNISVKNPADNHGWTPLQMAAFWGQFDVAKYIQDRIQNE